LPGQNGGGTAVAVPPSCKRNPCNKRNNDFVMKHATTLVYSKDIVTTTTKVTHTFNIQQNRKYNETTSVATDTTLW